MTDQPERLSTDELPPDCPPCSIELTKQINRATSRRQRQRQREAAMTHDVAGCALLACELCDAYGSGWAAGKDKLAFEVEAVKDNPHGAGCGCRPCALVRVVLGVATVPGPLSGAARPAVHLSDCAGPGCGATCGCWCHVHERGRGR